MINFGISAYLRIISMNPKPMQTEIKKRSIKTEEKKSGYDFHSSLRRSIRKLMIEKEPIETVQKSINQISKLPERRSASNGLSATQRFISVFGGNLYEPMEHKYISPSDVFSVKFKPDFGLEKDGIRLAVHAWNTKSPTLTERTAKAGLALFASQYDGVERPAIICLRSMKLYSIVGTAEETKISTAFSKLIESSIQKYIVLEGDEDAAAA